MTLGTYTDRPRAYNLRRVIEQLPDVWPGKVQSQKATGTDGKPVDAVGKILSKSCFSGDSIRGNTKLCEKKTAKTVEKMPLNSGNKLADLTLNQRVTGSNPVSPIQKRGFSQQGDKELVSGLFSALKNDLDLRLIVERWPELPEHIKAAIKALVQTQAKGKSG